jgi:hypothetical protein
VSNPNTIRLRHACYFSLSCGQVGTLERCYPRPTLRRAVGIADALGTSEYLLSDYLEKIKSPADLKRLGPVELERLAEEIRERLIVGVAKTGGHIGPNLGVVELTIERLYAAHGKRA